jgi:hypothetical protein
MLPAAAAAAPPPAGDSASGLGTRADSGCGASCAPLFSFNATSGASGESPTGTFQVTFTGYASFIADVECLRVTGKSAIIAGTITSGNGFEADPGNPFLTVIEDYGGPRRGVSPDKMGYVNWGPTDFGAWTMQQACDDPTLVGVDATRFAITSGNIVVKDRLPVWDTASGLGVRAPNGVLFSFDAHSSPSGANPAGTFTMAIGSLTFTGSVTCLRVTGNTAVITGVIASGSGGSPDTDPGQPFVVIVEDHGKARHGVSPDKMSFVVFGTGIGDDVSLCADPDTATGPDRFALLSGDIVVKDR